MSRKATLIRSRISQVAIIDTHESDEYLDEVASFLSRLDQKYFKSDIPKNINKKSKAGYEVVNHEGGKSYFVKSFHETRLSDAIVFATKYFRYKKHTIKNPKYRVSNYSEVKIKNEKVLLKVINKETGKIYKNIDTASKDFGITYAHLRRMLLGGRKNTTPLSILK